MSYFAAVSLIFSHSGASEDAWSCSVSSPWSHSPPIPMAAVTSPQRYSCSPPNSPTEATAVRTHSWPTSWSPGRTSPTSSPVSMESTLSDALQMRCSSTWSFPSSRPSGPSSAMPVLTTLNSGRTAIKGCEGAGQATSFLEQVAVAPVSDTPGLQSAPVGPSPGQASGALLGRAGWLSVPRSYVVVVRGGRPSLGLPDGHFAVLPTPGRPGLRPLVFQGPDRVRLSLLLPGELVSVPLGPQEAGGATPGG